ncbi:EAL domain-containing protein [Brevundimonas sp. VNH65]|uniref:EAL domain-containing protein n=1 Tax=Brevundimonas sp. VNH65 TaxID=3400917 RepID=UPI003BFDFB63
MAFAASDLLIELDANGRVEMALGAGPAPQTPAERLVGRSLPDLLVAPDRSALRAMMGDLGEGRRLGPLSVRMLTGDGRARPAAISLFRLPDLAPAVSCALSWQGEAVAPPVTPMLDADGLIAQMRQISEHAAPTQMAVDFIDVSGLSEAGDAGERATEKVEAALQSASIGGDSAARLAPERYALLRDGGTAGDLAEEVMRLGREEGLELDVSASSADVTDAPPVNVLRALRFAAENCLKDGGLSATGVAFSDALSRAVKEAETFRAMVRDRAFEVHYQPIVDLRTGAVHHFEALSRFRSPEGPAGVIRMAEELALIESFDLVVLEKVVRRLTQPGSGLLKIAVNVSGASLADDAYIRNLLRLTANGADLRRRLIVEVTESAALADIAEANRRLSLLREAGIRVCIDDFGAGAASFDYIRKLQVDTVKIDGKLIHGLEEDARARTMVAHLVELCGSLGLTTVAEMVETQAAADILRDLGVDYAQGWLFGRAEAEPRTVLNDPPIARRAGAMEAWG